MSKREFIIQYCLNKANTTASIIGWEKELVLSAEKVWQGIQAVMDEV